MASTAQAASLALTGSYVFGEACEGPGEAEGEMVSVCICELLFWNNCDLKPETVSSLYSKI